MPIRQTDYQRFIFIAGRFEMPSFIFAIHLSLQFTYGMKIKSFLAKPFASYIYKGIRKGMVTALADQENILQHLIKVGKATEYGKSAGLDKVNKYEEFKQAISIRDYEQMRPWIEKIKEGRHNVLW